MTANTYVGNGTANELKSIYFGKSIIVDNFNQEYQQVDYLETDGNAYIMTTHQPSTSTKTIAKFSNLDTSKNYNLFGCYQNSEAQSWVQWDNGEFKSAYGNDYSSFSTNFSPEINNFIVNKNSNNTKIIISNSTQVNTQEGTFTKPELYGTIFGINGEDPEKKVNLPNEYTQVEYLESTGTQYIDTGLLVSSDLGFEITFSTESAIASSGHGVIFGAENRNSEKFFKLSTYSSSSSFNGSFERRITTAASNTRVNAGITLNQKLYCKLDHNIYTNCNNSNTTMATVNINITNPIYIFAIYNETKDTLAEFSKTKLYNLKLYYYNNSEEPAHDYYPCVRKSDNKPGLYDIITNSFLANNGTGEFIVGPAINVWKSNSGLRLYSYKTYNGDTIVRNYIPCYRKSDNELGLYDIVQGIFYTNANTSGTFTYGEKILENYTKGTVNKILRAYIGDNNNKAKQIFPKTYLPSGYQQVKYIEGTGEQYINTGEYLSVTTLCAEIIISITDNVYTQDACILGCFGQSSKRFCSFIKAQSDDAKGKVRMGLGAGYWTDSAQIDTDIHIYKLDMADLKIYKDNVSKTKSSSSAYSRVTDVNAWIGILSGYHSTYTNNIFDIVKGKIYNVKIWKANELIHNYYPCYRESDGEPGLYDLVATENKFLTNAGTSAFLIGEKYEAEL